MAKYRGKNELLRDVRKNRVVENALKLLGDLTPDEYEKLRERLDAGETHHNKQVTLNTERYLQKSEMNNKQRIKVELIDDGIAILYKGKTMKIEEEDFYDLIHDSTAILEAVLQHNKEKV